MKSDKIPLAIISSLKTIPEQLVVSLRWQGPYSDTGKAMGKYIAQEGAKVPARPSICIMMANTKKLQMQNPVYPLKKQLNRKLECKTLPAPEVCIVSS